MERLVARYLAGELPFQTHAGTAVDGAMRLTDAQGCALFGPYLALHAGCYTARILFAAGADRTGHVTMDVAAQSGRCQIREAIFDLENLPCGADHIEMDFEIDGPQSGFEIRLFCYEPVSAVISAIELEYHRPKPENIFFFHERPAPQFKKQIKQDWVSSTYYDTAEQEREPFWSDGAPFNRMFNTLDLANVVELACGHGRHSAYIRENYSFGHLTLVDINKPNIIFCKRRFAADKRFSYLVNSGADLAALASGKYSSLFCYDAMVHFEYDDVISYMKDIYRILCPEGRALLHHSNYDNSPGTSYADNPHWRNFMSSGLFAHAAARSGFVVVEQQPVDWGGEAELDCVTLLEKPGAEGHPNRRPQNRWRPWRRWWCTAAEP
jgi:SAM-dependent methyltransferase